MIKAMTNNEITERLFRARTLAATEQQAVVIMTGALGEYGGLLCQRVLLVQPDGAVIECGMPVAVGSAPSLGDLARIS